MSNPQYIENTEPSVKLGRGLNTKLPMTLSGTNATLTVGGTLAVTGATTFNGGIASPSSSLSALAGQASTSGGVVTPAVQFGSDGVGIYWGAGAPTISAAKGSLYLNTTGSSTSTRLYVNNGTTTWVAVTTAS